MRRTLAAEFLAGCVGIILGIITIAGYQALALTSVVIILFGGAIVLGGVGRALSNFAVAGGVSRQMAAVSFGSHVLAGLSLIALGIVTLIGVSPWLLNLLALLGLGGVLFLSGASATAVFASMFKSDMFGMEHRPPEIRAAA